MGGQPVALFGHKASPLYLSNTGKTTTAGTGKPGSLSCPVDAVSIACYANICSCLLPGQLLHLHVHIIYTSGGERDWQHMIAFVVQRECSEVRVVVEARTSPT